MEQRKKWKPPHPEDWNKLFKAALRFRNTACWSYMENEDIFGIEDPVSGDPVFCSVLGANEEYFGLAAYIGFQGFHTLEKMILGDPPNIEDERVYEIRNLICSFEPWENLLMEEQIQAEKFDPRLKTDPFCPGFISYEPGYIPYSLSQEECQLVSILLAQAIPISKRFQTDPLFLVPEQMDQVLVRRAYTHNRQGTPLWRYAWKTVPAYFPLYPVMHIQNPETKKRLNAYPVEQEMQWEIDFRHMPFIIEEGYKPYYPRTLFIADHQTGYVLEPVMCNDIESPEIKLLASLIKLLDQYKLRPSAMYASDEQTLNLFSMISSELGIPLIRTQNLPILDEVKKSLFNSQLKPRSSTIH